MQTVPEFSIQRLPPSKNPYRKQEVIRDGQIALVFFRY